MKETKGKLWFKAKIYGWGWYPASIEGWFVTIAYIIALSYVLTTADENSHSVSDSLISAVLPSIVLTLILIFICYKKGEKPYWRWGGK